MKSIFVVHTWETADGKHHVTVWNNVIVGSQESFDTWTEAIEYADKKAKELGLDMFQIDHPDLPHRFIRAK